MITIKSFCFYDLQMLRSRLVVAHARNARALKAHALTLDGNPFIFSRNGQQLLQCFFQDAIFKCFQMYASETTLVKHQQFPKRVSASCV